MPQTRFGGQKGRNPQAKKALAPSPSLLEEDLLKMKKTELVDLAGSLGIALEPKATKALIVEALLENG